MFFQVVESAARRESGLNSYPVPLRGSDHFDQRTDKIPLGSVFKNAQQFDASRGRHARLVCPTPFYPARL